MLVHLVIALTVLVEMGRCGKILGIVATPSYSHQVVFQPLFRQLSLRGHQVTVLTTDPVKDQSLTNLTEIDLSSSYKIWNEHIMKNVLIFSSDPITAVLDLYNSSIQIQDEQLSHPSVQALIKGDGSFDVIIIEAVMPAFFMFVAKFKCPYIAMISMDAHSEWYGIMGNPTHPVAYPDGVYPFDRPLSFFQRVASVILTPSFRLFNKYILSLHKDVITNHFGVDYPPLIDIINKPDMLFVNTDPIFHQARPLVPTTIQIGGGSHMKAPKPLPADLQKVLNGAKKGFLYFSLGTNVKSKDIPLELRNVILETFSQLSFTVLWKFEDDNLPSNVIIAPWFPQQDILRHPNIKLFITQGGVQSIEEATYSGVPMVIIPFFGDQAGNAKRMEIRGVAVTADYNSLTKEDFQEKFWRWSKIRGIETKSKN